MNVLPADPVPLLRLHCLTRTLRNSMSVNTSLKTTFLPFVAECTRYFLQDYIVGTLDHGPSSVWMNISRLFIIIIIYPLTARVVGAPQMILQPVFSIFLCSPLPAGPCRTLGLSIPWWCLPTSSFVRLVFFPLSLCLARWFWPDLMNGRHDHTTCSLRLFTIVRRFSCGPIACLILAGTSSMVTWSLYKMCSILR